MKNYYRPDEAAKILNITARSIYRLITDGIIGFQEKRNTRMVELTDYLARAQTDRPMKPKEVANLLNVNRSMIYELYNFGELEGFKLRRSIRIWQSSVLAFIERQSA